MFLNALTNKSRLKLIETNILIIRKKIYFCLSKLIIIMADLENFDGQELIDKVQEKFDANKNYVYIGIAVILLGVGAYWWFSSKSEKKNAEANEMVWKPEFNFAKDSFDLAINGALNPMGYRDQGFASIAEEYDGTSAGEIAKYSMGVGYLNMGNFNAAINTLEDVSFDDEILGAVAKGALGDAYYEIGKADKAIDAYKEAVDHSDNGFTTPIYLKKLASVQEAVGDINDAISSYERIKNDYPDAQEAYGIEKYIAKLKK